MGAEHPSIDAPSQGQPVDRDGPGSNNTSQNNEIEEATNSLTPTNAPLGTIAIEHSVSSAKRQKSDSAKGQKPKRQYATNWKINWEELTDNLQASQNLQSTVGQPVPYHKVDELVGWATHTIQSSPLTNRNEPINPFLGLPSTPLPPSILYFIQEETARIIANDRKSNFHLLRNGFDQSALVSLGMIIEESITASFLPMARKHVQRCMEENTKGTKNRNATMNQWTATPEECFLQVVNHKQSEDRVPILPSMAPPVLSTMIGQPDYVPTHRSLLVDEAESALQQWADSQDLSLSFIKKNYKLFGLDNPEEVVNNAQDDMEEESDKKRKIVAV